MLPVNEIFTSFQGEGLSLGRAAFFIRLQGCPIRCPWCDSASTWDVQKGTKMSVSQLVQAATAEKASIVVITGGEPAIHDLTELTAQLKSAGKQVHLETSGEFALKGIFDWITLSPKRKKPPLAENLARANELKIIVDTPESAKQWLSELAPFSQHCQAVWLQPEWNHISDKAILNAIVQVVKSYGDPVRAGIQLHKYYNADALDPRAKDAHIPPPVN